MGMKGREETEEGEKNVGFDDFYSQGGNWFREEMRERRKRSSSSF